jgi:hypothetical protein
MSTASTMSEGAPNIRRERIEKLLHELRYEIERGMLERDIEEEMGFRFYVPISNKIPDGVVFCEFRTRPVPRHAMSPEDIQPRLRLVK